jgi:hypothetical protein
VANAFHRGIDGHLSGTHTFEEFAELVGIHEARISRSASIFGRRTGSLGEVAYRNKPLAEDWYQEYPQ